MTTKVEKPKSISICYSGDEGKIITLLSSEVQRLFDVGVESFDEGAAILITSMYLAYTTMEIRTVQHGVWMSVKQRQVARHQ